MRQLQDNTEFLIGTHSFSIKRLSIYPFKDLPCYISDCDRHVVSFVSCECQVCHRSFHGACGLPLHSFHVQCIQTNQCPRCLRTFATIMQARLHLKRFSPSNCDSNRACHRKYFYILPSVWHVSCVATCLSATSANFNDILQTI